MGAVNENIEPSVADTDAEETRPPGIDRTRDHPSLLALLAWRVHDDPLLNAQLDRLLKADRARLQAPFDPDKGLPELTTELTPLFLAAGRGPELEGLLLDDLPRSVQVLASRRGEVTSEQLAESGSYDTRAVLELLVDLYAQAGRDADVVALLDHAPYWEADNVAGLVPSDRAAFDGQVAHALQKTGHADAALRVVEASLDHSLDRNGLHPLYALLLELLPPDQADVRLAALASADPLDAQPLLWRSLLQWRQHRPQEAEKLVRQALAINATDGDGGPPDRPRAHAVLGTSWRVLATRKEPRKPAGLSRRPGSARKRKA